MTKLHSFLALEKGAKTNSNNAIDKAYKLIQKPELFAGISRNYTAKDDDGDQLPAESTKVQIRAESLLENTADFWTKLLDITATKDWGNTLAKADVKIDDNVIIPDAPVTYLIWLEKQLVDLHAFIGKLPTLDPAFDWVMNNAADAWATPAIETNRSQKAYRNHELTPATDKHPAQVQVYTEDEIVGKWATVKFSGAFPQARITTLLQRLEALQDAVKVARQEANTTDVNEVKVGENIFEYLFA